MEASSESRGRHSSGVGRCWNTVKANWYLGFYGFGGPPVHFRIVSSNRFHEKFVKRRQWIDEQTYQELFSICQAFSGPGSTKMHYCINLMHDGFLSAVLGFLIWSLPGALGMYGIAVGVSTIGDTLPRPVYALLSGLNSATVGIIALAAVQLAEKVVTDRLTRILLFFGASAGMLYNAIWYFPVLMVAAAATAIVFDSRQFRSLTKAVRDVVVRRRVRGVGEDSSNDNLGARAEEGEAPRQDATVDSRELVDLKTDSKIGERPESNAAQSSGGATASSAPPTGGSSTAVRRLPVAEDEPPTAPSDYTPTASPTSAAEEPRVVPPDRRFSMSWQQGLLVIVIFIASFIAVIVARGVSPIKPLLYNFFANMYLAGTIIFGGGPVVIPLLRSYVVDNGWVSARDFLIGLALIQSFPGPNFNFAVYLGGLTAAGAGYNAAVGALLGFLGIYLPGLSMVHGTLGVWSAIRGWRWVRSGLRGISAAAVGLIFTAVYRLWQVGWIDQDFQQGISLATDPWWVVVTATSYVGGYWFGLSPPAAIVLGAILGLIRYGVVSA